MNSNHNDKVKYWQYWEMDNTGVQKERQVKWLKNIFNYISTISSSDAMVLEKIYMNDLLPRTMH